MAKRSVFFQALILCVLSAFMLKEQGRWLHSGAWNDTQHANSTGDINCLRESGTGAGEDPLSFDAVNERLVRPFHTANNCGSPQKAIDCPRLYDLQDVNKSVSLGGVEENQRRFEAKLHKRHEEARNRCLKENATTTKSGGWCLCNPGKYKIFYQQTEIIIPSHHVDAAPRVLNELASMIQEENITSISDFGAGIGQYKAAMLKRRDKDASLSSLKEFNAYDGAGNVHEYTKGFLRFFDLTLPLSLPRTDWVLSFEVGEHVPSAFEGMVIRNLHYHNCRGIILSWAILGQHGHAHINNHSNEYIIAIFEQLGYRFDAEASAKFRNDDGNYKWFVKSLMVFRRHENVC